MAHGLRRTFALGDKVVNFPVCLAPMVGLSHVVLRLIVRSYLPEGAVVPFPTEMLNSRRIPSENLSQTPETLRDPSETGLVPQILGNEETFISDSVRKLETWGAVGIDINMGCPVKKALMHNYGVALMGDPQYAADVVRMTVRSTRLPVSVKLRSGLRADLPYLLEFVRGLCESGASWITLHPRLSNQFRRGDADWSVIQRVRESIEKPVIGNGDIQTADDVFQMLQETGCDLVMVGRAMTARPWLIWQVGEKLGWPPPPGEMRPAPQTSEEEGAEYGRMLKRALLCTRKYFSQDLGLRKFRFLVKTGASWLVFGHALVAAVAKAKTYDDVELTLSNFFSQPQSMSRHTQLSQ